jgi:hypothetical protein
MFALSRRHVVVALGAASVTVAALVAAPTAMAAPASGAAAAAVRGPSGPTVVVRGLNNPRQLSLVDQGLLLVAEAGKGGDKQVETPMGPVFVGLTGSVSGVAFPQLAHQQRPHRIVTGLVSGAGAPDGSFATGSDGVSAASVFGPIYIAETTAGRMAPLPAEFARQDGKLLSAFWFQRPRVVADITGFEIAHDPDGHGVESNPYAVLARRDGTQLVADAAGNDVLKVSRRGQISVFHVFPNITSGTCAGQADPPGFPGCNYVPTSLAQDGAGNIYVGGLAGETPGEGRVTKLDPSGQHVLRTWTGFTTVTGVAVGRDASVYVSQLFGAGSPAASGPGVLTKIRANGGRTNADVPFPAGVAVDAFNNVYVSAFSVAPESGMGIPGVDSSGQVWRLRF